MNMTLTSRSSTVWQMKLSCEADWDSAAKNLPRFTTSYQDIQFRIFCRNVPWSTCYGLASQDGRISLDPKTATNQESTVKKRVYCNHYSVALVANDGSFESPRPRPSICMVICWLDERQHRQNGRPAGAIKFSGIAMTALRSRIFDGTHTTSWPHRFGWIFIDGMISVTR